MKYEEKYNKTIESIKRIYEQADSFGKELMEKEFPELRESDDEMVRKELIQYLKDYPNLPNGNYCRDDFFAWLEKQGGQRASLNEEDDEDGLSEFEKVVQDILNEPHFQDVQAIKQFSKTLLDLARKEILKDLPKWKKCDDNLPYSHIGGLNNRYLIKNGYCIKISDLETLPTLPKED